MLNEQSFPFEVNWATEEQRRTRPPIVVDAYATPHPLLVAHEAVNEQQGPWVLTHGPEGGIVKANLPSLVFAQLLAAEIMRVFTREEMEGVSITNLPNQRLKNKMSGARKRVYDFMRTKRRQEEQLQ